MIDSLQARLSSVNPVVDTYAVVDDQSVGRTWRPFPDDAADTPLAQWLASLARERGWRSGRQAALYLGVRQPAFWTWWRGEIEPERRNQELLAAGAGVPLAEVADLVLRTKSQKQRLTVGDLKRMGAEEGSAPSDLGAVLERLDRIERRVAEGLTAAEVRAIFEDFIRRRDAGELPEYLDEPSEPDAPLDDDPLHEAVG